MEQPVTFLDKIAIKLIDKHQYDFSKITIVLPNKRARLFLLESFKKHSTQTFFAPKIISIEDLIADISQIQIVSGIELLFEFYEVYKTVTPKNNQQDFEQFSNWAKTLLQDFNEIDRYLLKPSHVFDYLKDIDDINHWSVKAEDRTSLIENYLSFWEQLPTYYTALTKKMTEDQQGYQGWAYRKAVEKLEDFTNKNSDHLFYFAGFNALNAAEEHIMQHLLKNAMAQVFWDTDETFFNDSFHDAGYFARKTIQKWSYYKSHPYEWMVNEFSEPKNIEIISTPKSVGQAKIVGSIVEKIQKKTNSLQNTAVVLSEENLLIPVLYALPQQVTSLNITMGYDSKSNPVQLFFSKLFKMQVHAMTRGIKAVYYHKEVADVLAHPLVEFHSKSKEMIDEINRRNLSFFDIKSLESFAKANDLLSKIINPWEGDVLQIIERLEQLVFMLKCYLQEENDDVSLTFLFAFHQVLNKIKNYQLTYQVIENAQQLWTIYKQTIDLAEVSFEGEPLEGLQVMGVLESRVLDFENVIITSLNEGKLPAGKSSISFIPHDVKHELGLPTFKEKDAIYTYHFYHLLQRAKNIYLLYNSDSEGLDAGEKSRFITQLLLEPQIKHQINVANYFAKSPETINEPMWINKSPLLNERLKEIASGKGFSPSAIGNYMRNPIQFYTQRILGIREVDEVEESIALNTLGTIIHNSLENLYKPFINQKLTVDMLHLMLNRYQAEVTMQFRIEYSDSDNRQGKNLLAFEVAKRHVYLFLKQEQEYLEQGDEVEILGLEVPLEATLNDDLLPYPVNLFGIADRIELRNGGLRIIDYKTGKVDLNQVRIQQIEGISADLKFEKAMQLLLYGLMYKKQTDLPLQVGIYSFKNRKSGYLMFGLKQEKGYKEIIDDEIVQLFQKELVDLLLQILDVEKAFEERVD